MGMEREKTTVPLRWSGSSAGSARGLDWKGKERSGAVQGEAADEEEVRMMTILPT